MAYSFSLLLEKAFFFERARIPREAWFYLLEKPADA